MSEGSAIVVVGSANTDLVVSVPHIPIPGETILGGDLQTIPGGKGANQAVAAARLGGMVTFVARVGDDAYGRDAIRGYQLEGIDTDFIGITAGVASGIALITVDASTGQNAIVVAPGANAHLTPADVLVCEGRIADAAMVVASLEVPLDAVVQAAELATRYGIPFLLNPAPARSLPVELLAQTALLTPNETEAAQLLGLDPATATPEELASGLIRTGVRDVILTMGKDGALHAGAGGITAYPTFVVRAVDTVAAGDCFTGALAVRLGRGDSMAEAIRYANAAAALKVTRPGAQPGLPTSFEVEAFLGEQGVSRSA